VVDRLVLRGVARAWTDAFHVAGPQGIEAVSSGPIRYAAPLGLRSVVSALADEVPGIAIESGFEVGTVTVADGEARVDDEAVRCAAVCMPRPQAARILDLEGVPEIAWEPVLSVTCVFERRQWIELDGVFVNDDAVITWIADDGSRRGDGAPVLVAHVHPVLSARHLDDPTEVLPSVVAAVQRVLAISDLPEWAQVHRWSLAKPMGGHTEPFWRHPQAPVGLAGDEWHGGPRVEAAWLSGRSLGTALAAEATSR
jgi:predicted NAD/FAD-dependent oxidoreductase